MRIISGQLGSRHLKSPPENIYLRPTTDRARETVFNILSNKISFLNLNVSDLFCGTGSFGLECISRGVKECTFVDKNTMYVKKNCELLGIKNSVKFIKSDAIKYLQEITDSPEAFDLIFADPPYIYDHYEKLINTISKFKTIFILEHESKMHFSVQSDKILLNKKIGISEFTIYDFRNNNF